MFLSAVAMSGIFFAMLHIVFPNQFRPVREKFMTSRAAKGLVPMAVGAFILGIGMAICGSCPGMVYIQLGAGVNNAYLTLIGGFLGGLAFGLIHPMSWMQSFLKVGCSSKHKLDDFPPFQSIQYPFLSIGLTAILLIPILLFEHFFPWDSTSELSTYTPWNHAWLPEVAGMIVGFLQVPAVLINAGTVGSSSTYMVRYNFIPYPS